MPFWSGSALLHWVKPKPLLYFQVVYIESRPAALLPAGDADVALSSGCAAESLGGCTRRIIMVCVLKNHFFLLVCFIRQGLKDLD